MKSEKKSSSIPKFESKWKVSSATATVETAAVKPIFSSSDISIVITMNITIRTKAAISSFCPFSLI